MNTEYYDSMSKEALEKKKPIYKQDMMHTKRRD